MIIKSHSKQRKRSVLITIQLFVAFFSINIGLGTLNASLNHISTTKSIISSDTINIFMHISANPFDISTEEKKNATQFYKDIQGDQRIDAIGSLINGHISYENSKRPDTRYSDISVVGIDDAAVKMFNIEGIKVMGNEDISKMNVFCGANVIKKFPIGSCISIYLYNGVECKITVSGKLKKKSTFLNIGYGDVVTQQLINTDNLIIAPLPKEIEPIFLNMMSANILVKLKDKKENEDYMKFVQGEYSQYNLAGTVHDINFELQEYMKQNSMVIIFSIVIALLIFVLSSLGIIGVILSSIVKRRIEFGIRYALGCTQKEIVKLIVGEIGFLFILGNILGISATYLISIFTKQIKIGIATIGVSSIMMLVFCCISALIPAIKLMSIEPNELIRGGKN